LSYDVCIPPACLPLYLVLERQKANLALARHNLKRIESDLSV
jgi:hypothetical protein